MKLQTLDKNLRSILISCLLLFAVDSKAVGTDTSCRRSFMQKAYDMHHTSYVLVSYVDSQGVLRKMVQRSNSVVEQIIENLKADEETILNELMRDTVLIFQQYGKLVGMEIYDTAFYGKWIEKGQRRFIRRFFRKNELRYEFMARQDVGEIDVIATAYDLGILISTEGLANRIAYISLCRKK